MVKRASTRTPTRWDEGGSSFLTMFLFILISTINAEVLAAKKNNVSEIIGDDKCRSNRTHVMWPSSSSSSISTVRSRRLPARGRETLRSINNKCWYQLRKDAEHAAMKFLKDNIMDFDLPYIETLGFPTKDEHDAGDGLSNGLIGPTITLSLDAKIQYDWADNIPQDIYYEYVLNYANVNEGRTNWRPLLTNAIKPYIDKYLIDLNEDKRGDHQRVVQVNDVVKLINTYLFEALGRGDKNKENISSRIYFVSSQTPLIFDPMSVIAFQYASCTGFAILFINALRTVGIPSRIVGTPAWHNNITIGNHNWVEVYRNGRWEFMEPTGGTSPYDIPEKIDHLDVNPCKRWFCKKSNNDNGTTYYYAAGLQKDKIQHQHYPMAWELDNKAVPGINRTDYYIDVCSQC